MTLLGNHAPYTVLCQVAMDYNSFRVFGCLCCASSLSVNRSKFDSRAIPSVFLGYPPGIKGYRLYDISQK